QTRNRKQAVTKERQREYWVSRVAFYPGQYSKEQRSSSEQHPPKRCAEFKEPKQKDNDAPCEQCSAGIVHCRPDTVRRPRPIYPRTPDKCCRDKSRDNVDIKDP